MTGIEPSQVTLGILAGGRSERMGRDKALVAFGPGTLLDHVLARYRDAGPILVARAPGAAPVPWPAVADAVEGEGPLRGLLTLLQGATTRWVCALAVDQPELPRAVVSLLRGLVEPGDDGVLLTFEDRPEPLPALLRASLAPEVERRLARGARRALDWMEGARVRLVPAVAVLGPAARASVRSLNDPEALRAAARRVCGGFDGETPG